jgi:hypothetical protein
LYGWTYGQTLALEVSVAYSTGEGSERGMSGGFAECDLLLFLVLSSYTDDVNDLRSNKMKEIQVVIPNGYTGKITILIHNIKPGLDNPHKVSDTVEFSAKIV